jgi:alcohol dehydrogenase
MIPFDFQLRTRIVFGPNSIDSLGELIRDELPRQIGHSEVLFGHELFSSDSEIDIDRPAGHSDAVPLAADAASVRQGAAIGRTARGAGEARENRAVLAAETRSGSTPNGAPQRVLMVSDPGVCAAGHVQRAIDSLEKAGLRTELFAEACENPTTREVELGAELARRFRPDVLIGLGGGSALDCAKGINFIYTNGGRMQDYWGKGKATRPMLPLIGIPTTSGTGSETQSFALISDAETRAKMACGDKKASCAIALLDPVLTVTQPLIVTALTGIDAVAHAVETYVTKPRNSISLSFSRESWRLLASNFVRVLREPENLEARGGMQLGACLAGLAIENSMLGSTHALANPLTATYHIPHGQAIALMLPHVVRYNGEKFETWYHELAAELDAPWALPPGVAGTDWIVKFVEHLVREAGLATQLSELDVDRGRLPELARDAMEQWTGGFNPRTPTESEYLELYQRAY